MSDFITYSPDQDVYNGTSMALDPKGSWVHIARARAMKAEIERLRALNANLQQVREAAEAWRADFALPVDHLRTARACLHLITALDEVKA